MIRCKSLSLSLFLACSLLLSQLGGAVHALSHLHQLKAHSGTQLEKQPAPDEICVACLAFSTLSAAATSQHACPESRIQHACADTLPAQTHDQAFSTAYHSRAPPRAAL